MNSNELDRKMIERVVLEAIRATNLARDAESRVAESPDAVLYGAGSALDSLGLVSLLIEVEEGLLEADVEVSLSDQRAMSQRESPFRSVTTLVDYIQTLGLQHAE